MVPSISSTQSFRMDCTTITYILDEYCYGYLVLQTDIAICMNGAMPHQFLDVY
jgi:hypothetical protein